MKQKPNKPKVLKNKTTEVAKTQQKIEQNIEKRNIEINDEKPTKIMKNSKSRKKNELNLSYSNLSFKAPTYQVLNNVHKTSKDIPPNKTSISMRRFTMSSLKSNCIAEGQFMFGSKNHK